MCSVYEQVGCAHKGDNNTTYIFADSCHVRKDSNVLRILFHSSFFYTFTAAPAAMPPLAPLPSPPADEGKGKLGCSEEVGTMPGGGGGDEVVLGSSPVGSPRKAPGPGEGW